MSNNIRNIYIKVQFIAFCFKYDLKKCDKITYLKFFFWSSGVRDEGWREGVVTSSAAPSSAIRV